MKKLEKLFYASSKISGISFKILSSEKGIKSIRMNSKENSDEMKAATKLRTDDPYMCGIFDQLEEYFKRERKKFNISLDITGTDFQKHVWDELSKIPYGKTISYKQLAKSLGSLKLVRAVGRANGANPVPIVIPCHRVINSNGNLGGYSGGTGIKEKLLELEGSLSLELFGG
jgi:methylated-DNA-[protein]-cysteine S-methyltransferase